VEKENTFRSGFVTIVGRPNVGKSTLMNHLIGQKIAITSAKPQTTRNRIRTVYTDENGQIVFLDTPGILRARHKLDEFMLKEAEESLSDVDLVLWIIEPDPHVGGADSSIAAMLKAAKKPVILVVNKIDKVTGDRKKEIYESFGKLLDFRDICAVSALRGIGVEQLRANIFRNLPAGPPFYDEDTVTDESMRQIASEIIREKALRLLSQEVPHGIAVLIEQMKQRDSGIWDIDATIVCEKASHKGIIIGRGGSMLKKIGTEARKDIEEMVESQVNLKLFVKVRPDWRDNPLFLKDYGYGMNNRK
jgi:GTP-binding protein Era